MSLEIRKRKSARPTVLFNGRVSVSRNLIHLKGVKKSVSRVNRIKHILFKNKFYTLTLPVKQPRVVKKIWISKSSRKPVYVPECGPEPPVLKTVYPCTQLEFTRFIDLQSASTCHKSELSGVFSQESLDTHQTLCLNDVEHESNLRCESHVPEYKNEIYECSCGFICDASTVFAHVKTNHNFLTCLYCFELFEDAKLLAFHLVNEHNCEERDYSSLEENIPCNTNGIFHFVCGSCEKTFNDQTEYLSHRCEKSSAIEEAVCENCNHHLETCNCGLSRENLLKENALDTNSNMEHSEELLNTQNKNPKNNETISHCSKQNVETLVENHNDKEYIQPANKYCKADYDHQLTGEQKSVQNIKERLHSEIQGETGMENMSKSMKSIPNKMAHKMTGKLIKKKNLRGIRNISIKKIKKAKLKTEYNKETLSKWDSKKVHNNKLMLEKVNKNFRRNESNYEPLLKGEDPRSKSSTIYNDVFENKLLEHSQSSKSSVVNISDSGKSSYTTTVPSLVPSPIKPHHVNKNMMNSEYTSLNVSTDIYDFDSSQPNHTESTPNDSPVSLEHLSENVPALHENHINDNFLDGNVTQVDELINISDIEREVNIAMYNNEVRNSVNVNNSSSDAELNDEELPFLLSFGLPIDAIPTLKLLKECVKVASSVCFYCKHADNLLVNCRELVLHIMSNHKFEIIINLDNGIHEKCDDLLPQLIDDIKELSHVFFYSDEFEQKSFNDSYECFHCSYASDSIRELYEHIRYSHEFNYFKCIWCQNYFYNYADLICHLCAGKYIPGTRIYFRCIVCSLENISSEYKLTQHLRENHHVCNVCLKESNNQVSLIKHICMHIGTCLNHFCSKCNIPYNHESEMREHVISAHNKNESRKKSNPKWPDICICNICRAIFPNKDFLEVHKKCHSIHVPTENVISAQRDSGVGSIRLQGINIQTVAKRSESCTNMPQLYIENPPITNGCDASVERKGSDSEESAHESDPMNISGPSSNVASSIKKNVNKSNLNRLAAPKAAQFRKLKKCLSSKTSQENNTVENQVIESVYNENSHYVETLKSRNIIEVRDPNEAKHDYSVKTTKKETSKINNAQILTLTHDMPQTYQSITDFSDSQNSSSLNSSVSYQLGNTENILLRPSDEGTSKTLCSAENVRQTSSSWKPAKFDNMMQPEILKTVENREHGKCGKRRKSTAHTIEITEISHDEYSSENLNDDDSQIFNDTLVEELKTPLNISSESVETKVMRKRVTKHKATFKKTLKKLEEKRDGMSISFSETDDSVFVDVDSLHAEVNNSEEVSADYSEESEDGKIYCYCRTPYDHKSEMIGCDGEKCTIEWFHFKCLGITIAPRGKWYCPECKGNKK